MNPPEQKLPKYALRLQYIIIFPLITRLPLLVSRIIIQKEKTQWP